MDVYEREIASGHDIVGAIKQHSRQDSQSPKVMIVSLRQPFGSLTPGSHVLAFVSHRLQASAGAVISSYFGRFLVEPTVWPELDFGQIPGWLLYEVVGEAELECVACDVACPAC